MQEDIEQTAFRLNTIDLILAVDEHLPQKPNSNDIAHLQHNQGANADNFR